MEDLDKILQQYVLTANSGKYEDWDEINSKFPELNLEKKKEETQEEASTGDSKTPATPSTKSGDVAEETNFDINVSQESLKDERLAGKPNFSLEEEEYVQDPVTEVRSSIEKSYAPNPIRNIVQKEFKDLNKQAYSNRNKEIDAIILSLDEEAKALGLESKKLSNTAIKMPIRGLEYDYDKANDEYNAIKQTEEQILEQSKDLQKRYLDASKDKYNTILAENEYDLYQSDEAKAAVKAIIQALPLNVQAGISLVGASKSTVESMIGSFFMDKATTNRVSSYREMEEMTSPQQSAILKESKEVQANKTEAYKKAED